MIKHAFVSAVSDDSDPNTIQPSDWNDAHVLDVVSTDPLSPSGGELWMLATGTTPNRLLELKFCDPVDGVVVTLLTVLR